MVPVIGSGVLGYPVGLWATSMSKGFSEGMGSIGESEYPQEVIIVWYKSVSGCAFAYHISLKHWDFKSYVQSLKSRFNLYFISIRKTNSKHIGKNRWVNLIVRQNRSNQTPRNRKESKMILKVSLLIWFLDDKPSKKPKKSSKGKIACSVQFINQLIFDITVSYIIFCFRKEER